MAKDHWLTSVAKVLRADTDDLRELARIGGVDPRTAYIGTRMDGADLRGQDLRGMLFTDLDLTRTQFDKATLIDPDQIAAAPPPPPLVLVATDLLDPTSVARSLAGLNPELFFGLSGLGRFLNRLEEDSPAIVIFLQEDMGTADTVLHELRSVHFPITIIVQGRQPRRQLGLWRSESKYRRVVHTLDQAMGNNFGRTALASDTRHLIDLLARHHRPIDQLLPPHSIFLRARGVGETPALDACAQLYDKIWRNELQDCGRIMTGPLASVPSAEWGCIEALLGLDKHQILPLPMLDVAAFLTTESLYANLAPDTLDYAQPLIRAIDQPPLADKEGWYPKLGLGDELPSAFRGQHGPALIDGAVAPAPSSGLGIDHQALRDFAFDKVFMVVVHHRGDMSWMLHRMITRGELWVTARDILGVNHIEQMTVWGLIATQLRRVVPQSGGRSRQAYLGLIWRAAIKRSIRDSRLMESLLDDGGDIRISNFEPGSGAARFTALLTPYRGRRTDASLRSEIEIHPDGPKITKNGG